MRFFRGIICLNTISSVKRHTERNDPERSCRRKRLVTRLSRSRSGMEIAQGQDLIIQLFRGVNETDEVFAHPPAFDFRMNGKNMNSALCQPGENFSLPLFHARFLETGQIRRDLNQIRSFMDKGFLCPRTTQIVEMEIADHGEDAIVDQPGRGAERGRSPSGQRFQTRRCRV